jgi:hypothetical protein
MRKKQNAEFSDSTHKSNNKKTNSETCKKDIERGERVPSWMLYMPRIVCYRLEKKYMPNSAAEKVNRSYKTCIYLGNEKKKKDIFSSFWNRFKRKKKK